jgi:hypothetical protein
MPVNGSKADPAWGIRCGILHPGVIIIHGPAKNSVKRIRKNKYIARGPARQIPTILL